MRLEHNLNGIRFIGDCRIFLVIVLDINGYISILDIVKKHSYYLALDKLVTHISKNWRFHFCPIFRLKYTILFWIEILSHEINVREKVVLILSYLIRWQSINHSPIFYEEAQCFQWFRDITNHTQVHIVSKYGSHLGVSIFEFERRYRAFKMGRVDENGVIWKGIIE